MFYRKAKWLHAHHTITSPQYVCQFSWCTKIWSAMRVDMLFFGLFSVNIKQIDIEIQLVFVFFISTQRMWTISTAHSVEKLTVLFLIKKKLIFVFNRHHAAAVFHFTIFISFEFWSFFSYLFTYIKTGFFTNAKLFWRSFIISSHFHLKIKKDPKRA